MGLRAVTWRGSTHAPQDVCIHLMHGPGGRPLPLPPRGGRRADPGEPLGADVTADLLPHLDHGLHPALIEKAMGQLRTFIPAAVARGAAGGAGRRPGVAPISLITVKRREARGSEHAAHVCPFDTPRWPAAPPPFTDIDDGALQRPGRRAGCDASSAARWCSAWRPCESFFVVAAGAALRDRAQWQREGHRAVRPGQSFAEALMFPGQAPPGERPGAGRPPAGGGAAHRADGRAGVRRAPGAEDDVGLSRRPHGLVHDVGGPCAAVGRAARGGLSAARHRRWARRRPPGHGLLPVSKATVACACRRRRSTSRCAARAGEHRPDRDDRRDIHILDAEGLSRHLANWCCPSVGGYADRSPSGMAMCSARRPSNRVTSERP